MVFFRFLQQFKALFFALSILLRLLELKETRLAAICLRADVSYFFCWETSACR